MNEEHYNQAKKWLFRYVSEHAAIEPNTFDVNCAIYTAGISNWTENPKSYDELFRVELFKIRAKHSCLKQVFLRASDFKRAEHCNANEAREEVALRAKFTLTNNAIRVYEQQ